MITENPRKYGEPPYSVVLIHGGPGAPGEMAPVAKELSKGVGVLEPFQTKNTIRGQVEELKQQIKENVDVPVVLVGWSWGAWLSFIFTAENSDLVKKLILISSGPFKTEYAQKIMPTRLAHLSAKERERANVLMNILQTGNANDAVLQEFGELMSQADAFDSIKDKEKEEKVEVQSDIYESVWREAETMRKSGELLKYGEKITCPVVVIHGDYDSHPFEGVKEPLSKILKNIRFFLLKDCGHHPWLERKAREQFYTILRQEL